MKSTIKLNDKEAEIALNMLIIVKKRCGLTQSDENLFKKLDKYLNDGANITEQTQRRIIAKMKRKGIIAQ